MNFSRIGFGCYRTDINIKEHYDALIKALTSGINLIDTSANYADGRSEQLIGKVIDDLTAGGKLSREDLTLVTKGGYIQGQNFRFASRLKAEGNPFSEVVEFADRLWHCISPDFLQDQISRQLHRLNQEYIDIYLLHNPEYFLEHEKSLNTDLNTARKIYYERIGKAFEFLETKVREGKIGCYGISSNTFPVRSNEYTFTSLEEVLKTAESVSAGNHFRVIQMPFNLIEAGAVTNKNQSDNKLTVTEFACANNIKILINRPLNAISSKGLVRFSDFSFDAFNEKDFIRQIRLVRLMEDDFMDERIANENLSGDEVKEFGKLFEFGRLIEENWKFFGSIEHFNDMIMQNFAPKISAVTRLTEEKISDEDLKKFSADYIKETYLLLNFVGNYYKMKAAKRSSFIHGLINKNLDGKYHSLTLSQKTMLLLASVNGIDGILAGIRKESYVDDALQILSAEKIKNAKEIIRFVSEEIEISAA